jgi:ABC-type lipoprotein release transport system permease subunit
VLCAAPIVATLVSERTLARAGEFAILRAAGLAPAGIVTLTGLLYGALGAVGGVLGLAGGTLLAPLVTGESAELLAAPGVVGPAPAAAFAVAGGTAALAAIAAALPAWVLSRRPASEARTAAASGGRRRASRLARAARRARLPLPVVLGAGDAFARRPRALLAILALALSVAALIGAMAMEDDLARDRPAELAEQLEQTTADPGGQPFDAVSAGDTEAERLRRVVYPGVAALLALGLANFVAVLALALREARRENGILRAVGLTPRDLALTVVCRQLTLAVAAALVGIPLGLALWQLAVEMSDDAGPEAAFPSAAMLAAAAGAAIAACALVAAPLARHAARVPVARVLRQE